MKDTKTSASEAHVGNPAQAHQVKSREVSARTRTSLTDPLRINEVSAGDAGGLIGITFCPGKCASSWSGPDWQRDLAADLDVIANWGASVVVTLVEEHELQMLGVADLGQQVQARGIAWHHWPIVDVAPPDARFEQAWQASGAALVARIRAGERVLVHCRGGLGRAGTVAACLLVALDVPPTEAIRRVRSARRGAIETSQQEDYVRSFPQRKK